MHRTNAITLRLRRRSLVRSAAGLAVTLMLISDGALARHPSNTCQAVIDAKLAKHGMAGDDVTSRKIIHRRSGGEAGRFMGYSAWLRLKHCKGYVVVDLSRNCDIEQAYVKGDCRAEGLKRY